MFDIEALNWLSLFIFHAEKSLLASDICLRNSTTALNGMALKACVTHQCGDLIL
ncbi:hypothetical protein DTO96_100159 [Ephemeroptericola cinctiostellae]|uniref:Uncharacterized protein n=1 Tax=Ephemeroptericola cinctiostellae TaxID=2268024 RepID=A0A345D7W3_9BURK|nr:hypothetical protein DTO96_100159 [Ephemeroptericola cinctiostellae]